MNLKKNLVMAAFGLSTLVACKKTEIPMNEVVAPVPVPEKPADVAKTYGGGEFFYNDQKKLIDSIKLGTTTLVSKTNGNTSFEKVGGDLLSGTTTGAAVAATNGSTFFFVNANGAFKATNERFIYNFATDPAVAKPRMTIHGLKYNAATLTTDANTVIAGATKQKYEVKM